MAPIAYPRLAGQQAGYIKAQLQAWKGGARSNDPVGLMKTVADRLTDAEIDAVAAYYAAQPGTASTADANASTPVPEDVKVAPGDVYPGAVTQQGAPPPGRSPDAGGYFQSPARDALPVGPFGEVVAQGQAIFENTNSHPVSSKYVGNDQACGNCHIDAGRLAQSAPLWASWVAYSDGRTLFPPLWGAESYNCGAGMHKIDTAAAFIKHNMPLGSGGSLSDRDAWDVAAYMNSQERPRDPRHQGDLAATTEQFHGSKFDYFGKRKGPGGELLGAQPAVKPGG